MDTQRGQKLNRLQHLLPEGLLADTQWLETHGYSSALRSKYVANGWLSQPARGVYVRPGGIYRWEPVVISLQSVLRIPVAVGGATALNLQGFAHYLALGGERSIHLYTETSTPSWLRKIDMPVTFVTHRATKLFRNDPISNCVNDLPQLSASGDADSEQTLLGGLKTIPWGQRSWAMLVSTPERAILEVVDELPTGITFEHVDKLMEGLSMLSPRRLQDLLEDCASVKVKRLFLWLADRHQHAWRTRIDENRIDLGSGKRMIVKGGRLDSKYKITVPEALGGDL